MVELPALCSPFKLKRKEKRLCKAPNLVGEECWRTGCPSSASSSGSPDSRHCPFSSCPTFDGVFSFPILVFGSSTGCVCFQEPPSTAPSVHALLSPGPPNGCLASPRGEQTGVHPGRGQSSQSSTCFLSGIAILNKITHKQQINSYTTRHPLTADSK